MEIYGGGYDDDVDYFRYNVRQDKTHSQSMIEQLEKVVLCYRIALKYIETCSPDSYQNATQTYGQQFVGFLNFQK